MELSRWGFNKLTQISDRYRDFSRFLADVLEGDRSLISDPKKDHGAAFEVRGDIESLMSGPAKQTVGNRFFQLMHFFEAGFMLQSTQAVKAANSTNSTSLALQSMFLFGKTFLPQPSEVPNVELCLPVFSKDHVYRGRTDAVLRAFHLENLERLRSANAFAFSPRDGLIFILICNRPHPWQVAAIEAAVSGFLAKGRCQ
jgi:hypothetical protein